MLAVEDESALNVTPGLAELLKQMRAPKEQKKYLKSVEIISGERAYFRVHKKSIKETRAAIHSLRKALKAPSWSRWITFATALQKMLAAMVFSIAVIVGRLYGDQLKIKEDYVPNHLTLKERRRDDNFTLCTSGHFVHELRKPVDHYLLSELGDKIRPRDQIRRTFRLDCEEVRLCFEDIATTTRQIELITQQSPLSPEQLEAALADNFNLICR
ncbi:unnamed protein product [Amoebophrya sp. A25]|nr:unnamed protein product [Amoebophrya sp. A25]|eukprot:GSA25T00019933001.1